MERRKGEKEKACHPWFGVAGFFLLMLPDVVFGHKVVVEGFQFAYRQAFDAVFDSADELVATTLVRLAET